MRTLICCLCLTTVAGPCFAGENWPEFRGPTGQGICDSTGLPLTWSEKQHVKWKTAVHGKGWSTPVVYGDQVWLTTATADGTKMSVLCIDRGSGEVLLDRVQFENKPQEVEPLGNPVNAYSSPSPAIEAGRVFVHWGSYGTACIDTKTFETLWERRDLPCRHFRGPGSSLVLFRDTVILTMDGVDVQYLIALDKKTGEQVWRTDRTTDFKDLDPQGKPKMEGDLRKAYTTPVFVTIDGQVRMVSTGARATFAYDPTNGRELWTITYPGFSNASRPVYGDGMWYINTGYGRAELWAVRAGGKGDVTDSHVAWKLKRNVPNRSSPVVVDGLIFMVDDGGIASCVAAGDGQEVWRHRLGDGRAQYSSSVVYADGRVYFFDQAGLTTVVAAGRELKVLAENRLDAGFMASPAVAGKAFYLRTTTHLYRVEQ